MGSRLAMLNAESNRDEKALSDALDILFAAMDGGDKEGIKSVFAKAVIKENPEIDDEIDAFLQAYNGPMEIKIKTLSGGGTGRNEYGKKQWTMNAGGRDLIVSAGGVRYYIYVKICTIDDFDKDNEGVQTLTIATKDAYGREDFMPYGNRPPGFYYYDSPEKREDISWIEFDYYEYEHYDRALSADDLLVAAEKNDSWDAFVAAVGEANGSMSSLPDYQYYYELDNGLFAVCLLGGAVSSSTPPDLIRSDCVVTIYIADDEKKLETIWMADDITMVHGYYFYYIPVDRELSEEFFKSFFARSKSVSKLEEEIGPPNIKHYGTYYYILSDGRFVECSSNGDDHIYSFGVSDSEERLYVLSPDSEGTGGTTKNRLRSLGSRIKDIAQNLKGD
ncbi:MAG: DUF5104 domain-containing protein [Oscillospiraceae bacterium]|nr:DUF5104 domain-containing protein [Oscillospiraceae bacterium]